MMMSGPESLTWAAHIKLLFQQYNLPDPLGLISSQVWPKEQWKVLTKTSVTVYHERILRQRARENSKLRFLNTQVSGLSGRPHPVLSSILCTQEVTLARTHVKMLSGDYPCFSYIGSDRHKDGFCRLCHHLFPQDSPPVEDMVHLLVRCRSTADTRADILIELLDIISTHSHHNILLKQPNHTDLAQFILDPTSLNLPLLARISPNHSALSEVLRVCRKLCFATHKTRTKQLKNLKLSD